MADAQDTKAIDAVKDTPQTVEVGGVEYPLFPDKLADMRFVMMMGDLNDDGLSDEDKLTIQSSMFRFVFGAGRYGLLDKVAEASGGTLDASAFQAWWLGYLTAANAKNS